MSGIHNHSLSAGERHDPETERLMRRASYASLTVGLILTVTKAAVWFSTDSLSLFASMFDSLMDVAASAINLMAIHYSLQPPDDEHRFGHGKAEDIAAFAQAAFIFGSGLFICFESIKRLIYPEVVHNSGWGIVVMVLSVAMTAALVTYQRHVISKTNSIAVRSDSLHYFTDLLGNIAVIIALVLTVTFNFSWADPAFALLIAAYIFYGAWHIGHHAFQNLMDREFSEEERQKIMTIATGHEKVLGMHDLRTRRSGIYNFIQFHLALDGNLNLSEANKIAHEVEHLLEHEFPNLEVLIHQDPHKA